VLLTFDLGTVTLTLESFPADLSDPISTRLLQMDMVTCYAVLIFAVRFLSVLAL